MNGYRLFAISLTSVTTTRSYYVNAALAALTCGTAQLLKLIIVCAAVLQLRFKFVCLLLHAVLHTSQGKYHQDIRALLYRCHDIL